MSIFYPINTLPPNDNERVLALNRYEIFNAPKEKAFDNIVSLAQTIFDVPIAHLSFLDSKHEFVMASEGLAEIGLIRRGESLCALTVLRAEVVVIENALEEPILKTHPYVNGFRLKILCRCTNYYARQLCYWHHLFGRPTT